MNSYKIKLDGKKFRITGKSYTEACGKLISTMKKSGAKLASIRVSNRVDSIEQNGKSWHWNHAGFKFNTTGPMNMNKADEFFKSI